MFSLLKAWLRAETDSNPHREKVKRVVGGYVEGLEGQEGGV
jgi:hypothetical protein